jgi:hypothetical protein
MSHINSCAFSISNTPGTSGAFTVSAAISGPYRVPRSADNGKTFKLHVSEGSAWEVCDSVYTHSGTSMSRGALEDSSTGSRINFTSAAVVQVISASAAQLETAATTLTEAARAASYGFYVASDGTNKQTITDATWSVLNGGSSGVLRAVDYNAGSVWSADANGRATLPAGRWLIGGCATIEQVDVGQRIFVAVSKNGSVSPAPHRLLARSGPAAAINFVGLSGSTIVESNGSDYFSLVVLVDGSATHLVSNTANYTYFWAQYLGPVL